jgi:hypothetical protein
LLRDHDEHMKGSRAKTDNSILAKNWVKSRNVLLTVTALLFPSTFFLQNPTKALLNAIVIYCFFGQNRQTPQEFSCKNRQIHHECMRA